MQKRCDAYGLKVDRTVFYNIGSPEILQLFDGISRIISKKDPWRGEHDNGVDGLRTITQLKYTIDEKSENPNDNIFPVHNCNIFFINITTFLGYIPFGSEEYYNYDLREPKRKIVNPDKIRETKKTVTSTNDWSKIPYYPTTREKRENEFNNFNSIRHNNNDENFYQQQQYQQQQYQQQQYQQQVPHKYSPQYAGYVGAKSRAQASARIRLGGVY